MPGAGRDQPPSQPERSKNDESCDADDGGENSNNDCRRGRLVRNKSTKMVASGRRRSGSAPGAFSVSYSGLNFDASFSALAPGGCPQTPLSRERSKLCRLSASNSSLNIGSNHSSTSRGSRASRGSTQRRRTAQMPPMLDLMMNSSNGNNSEIQFDGSASVAVMQLDGDSSIAQLQVGDYLMLANKEMSTSSHLRRRMPKRNPRRSSSRNDSGSPAAAASASERGDESSNKDEVDAVVSRIEEAIGVVESLTVNK